MMHVRLVALAASEDGKRAMYERVGLFVFPTGGALAQVGATVAPVTIEDDAAWDVELTISAAKIAATVIGDSAVKTYWWLRIEVFMGKASP